MRASIHVSAQPSAPCREQAVGRVDADAVARAVDVVLRRSASSDGRELGAELVVAGDGRLPADGVDEPQRAVDGVVLERAGVGGVREHPLRHRRRGRAQHLAALVVAVGREVEAFVRRHQVARPLAEPRIAGDRCRAGRGRDRELVGGEHELRVDRVGWRRAPQHELARAAPRRSDDLLGLRQRAVERRGRSRHLVRLACVQLDRERAGSPEVLDGRPGRAPPPRGRGRRGTTRRPAASPRRRAGTPLEDEPVGGRLDARGRRSRMPLAVHARARCRAASARAARAGRCDEPVHDADRRAAVRKRQLALEHDRRRSASASAGTPSSRSNVDSSSCPRGSTRRPPTRRSQGGSARRRRRARDRARRDRASGAPARRPRRRAARGSGASEGPATVPIA